LQLFICFVTFLKNAQSIVHGRRLNWPIHTQNTVLLKEVYC